MDRHVFRLRRANPTTPIEAGKLYGAVVNKITYRNLVRAGKWGLTWDVEGVRTHIELSVEKNARRTGYHTGVYSKFGFSPTPIPEGVGTDMLDVM